MQIFTQIVPPHFLSLSFIATPCPTELEVFDESRRGVAPNRCGIETKTPSSEVKKCHFGYGLADYSELNACVLIGGLDQQAYI